MPLSRIDLKTELTTDPTSRGYTQFLQPISARDNLSLANLLNQRQVSIQIPREPISTVLLFSFIDPTNFLALTTINLQRLQVVLTMPTINLNDSSIRQILQGIFTGMNATLSNFASLRNRPGSRYEQLTSPGEIVTADYISQALDL